MTGATLADIGVALELSDELQESPLACAETEEVAR